MPRIYIKTCMMKCCVFSSFMLSVWFLRNPVYDSLSNNENIHGLHVGMKQVHRHVLNISKSEHQEQSQSLIAKLENLEQKYNQTHGYVGLKTRNTPPGNASVFSISRNGDYRSDHVLNGPDTRNDTTLKGMQREGGSGGGGRINGGKDNAMNEPEREQPPSGPGEMGEGVVIDPESLSPEERKRYDEGWTNNAFNEYVSDMISLERSLPDNRDPRCRSIVYSNLPDASVIVIFHNEAWTVLLRSVHSIINRTPPELLKEIILVDDFSDKPHLHRPLEEYVSRLQKVKLIRTGKREGLIRARLLGYSVATGTVLIFLDSHIECSKGWIEPLLDLISKDKTIAVTPVIEFINANTLEFTFTKPRDIVVGGFDWKLTFIWHRVPETEKARRHFMDILPIRSPTMAGGLFAIHRQYFTDIGTYDEDMNIWGAENLEISLRIWMCGGRLMTHPCSHVGHIFRTHLTPYTWPGEQNILLRNNMRLAEVWLDEFKKYYYNTMSSHEINNTDYGDITERKKLRERLNCKSFAWYIRNVFPEMFIPGNSIASGEIRNKARNICLDGYDNVDANNTLHVYPCHGLGGTQFWLHMKEMTIRKDDVCLDNCAPQREIYLYRCHGQGGHQEWKYREDNSIYHVNTGKCITLSADGLSVFMDECRATNNQLWIMERKPFNGPIP